jgi:hypothetical protein
MQITTGVLAFTYPTCDLHLGDSRLQSIEQNQRLAVCCDLHLGDSRLPTLRFRYVWVFAL